MGVTSKSKNRSSLLTIVALVFFVALLILITSGCGTKKNANVIGVKPINGKLVALETPADGVEKVTLGLYVKNIYDIDLASNTYYLTAYLWARWTGENDPTATLELINAVDEWGLMLTPLYPEPKKLSDGSNYQILRIQGRFYQPFDLVNYPLDSQKLTLLVENSSDTVDKVVYVPDTTDSGFDKSLLVPGWQVEDMHLDSLAHDYGTGFGDPAEPGVYSTLRFSLNLVRQQNMFLWKLLLPLLIVLVTNWLALVLDPGMDEMRAAMPATALLTTVFLQQASLDAIPAVSSLVLMDKIYAVTYLVVLLTFGQVIWDIIHNKTDDEVSHKRVIRADYISLALQVGGFVLVLAYLVWSVL